MNRDQFVSIFNEQLAALKGAETITRQVLKGMSRELLSALHGKDGQLYGDIQYVNALLLALTPVNKKVAIKFFEHFAGFHYDEGQGAFTKKSKKRGAEAQESAVTFLQDPNNNIWSWADRHIQVEAKPFTDAKLTQYVENAIKKMAGDQVRVLKAVFAAGITPDALIVAMQQTEHLGIDLNVEGEVKDPSPEAAPF
jgi:uncharacterized protein YneR